MIREIYYNYSENSNKMKTLILFFDFLINAQIYRNEFILTIDLYEFIKYLIIYIYENKNKIKEDYIPSSGKLNGILMVNNYFSLNKNDILGIVERKKGNINKNKDEILKNLFIDNINYNLYNKEWLKTKIDYNIDNNNNILIMDFNNYKKNKNFLYKKIKEDKTIIILISNNINEIKEFTNNIIFI